MRDLQLPTVMPTVLDTLVLAGHSWFGMHSMLYRRINVCTVLREPASRVVWDNLWRAGNRGQPPSAAGSQHDLDSIALSNIAPRTLSGRSEISWQSVGRAVEDLES